MDQETLDVRFLVLTTEMMIVDHSENWDAVHHNDGGDDELDPSRTSLGTLFVVAMVLRMTMNGSLFQLT